MPKAKCWQLHGLFASVTMAVTKDKKPNTGAKPNHGMDKNRPNKDTGNMRSAATVCSRLHLALEAATCPGVYKCIKHIEFHIVFIRWQAALRRVCAVSDETGILQLATAGMVRMCPVRVAYNDSPTLCRSKGSRCTILDALCVTARGRWCLKSCRARSCPARALCLTADGSATRGL